MIQYIADEAHFKEVIARVPKVKRSLWIGTADIKDLYVEERPFLGLIADLIKKGKYGVSVALVGNEVTHNKLSDIAGVAKPVPKDHQMVELARNIGISFGD